MPLHLCRRPPVPHSPRQQWLGCAVAGPLPFCALCVSAPSTFHLFRQESPQIMPALTHLNATLTNHPTSVDSKQLTTTLNPPESTLTKNMGGVGVQWLTTQLMRDACPEEASRRRTSLKSDEACLSCLPCLP